MSFLHANVGPKILGGNWFEEGAKKKKRNINKTIK